MSIINSDEIQLNVNFVSNFDNISLIKTDYIQLYSSFESNFNPNIKTQIFITDQLKTTAKLNTNAIKLYAVNDNYRVKKTDARLLVFSRVVVDYVPFVKTRVQAEIATANNDEEPLRSLFVRSELLCDADIVSGKIYRVEIDLAALGINWQPNVNYRFEFSDDFVRDKLVYDLDVVAPSFEIDYTTNTEPEVERFDPLNEETNSSNNTYIEIEFDRNVRSSYEDGFIYLKESSGALVKAYNINGDVIFTNNRTIRLDTLKLMKAQTTYVITSDEGIIRDYDNISLSAFPEYSFTTGDFDFPDLVSFKFVDAELSLEYIRYRDNSAAFDLLASTDTSGQRLRFLIDEVYSATFNQSTINERILGATLTFDVTTDAIISASYIANGASSFDTVSLIQPDAVKTARVSSQLDTLITMPQRTAVKTARSQSNFPLISELNSSGSATYRISKTLPLTFNSLTNTDFIPVADLGTGYYTSAISGNNVALSSPNQVKIVNGTTGALIRTITGPGLSPSSFGISISLDGDNLLVGDHLALKAYLYNISTGNLIYTFSRPTGVSGAYGYTVSIKGNYALVGSPTSVSGSVTSAYNVTTGAFIRLLARSGYRLAISGNYAIFGDSRFSVINNVSYQAPVEVFNIDTGSLVYTFNNPNPFGSNDFDQFGNRLDAFGTNLIVGAYGEDELAQDSSGKAYIYNLTNGTLTYTLNNPNDYSTPGGDLFGYSVSISSNYAVVSAVREGSYTNDTGKIYFFDLTDGDVIFALNNPGPINGFGFVISLSDNSIVVLSQPTLETEGSATSSAKQAVLYTLSGLEISKYARYR